MSVTIVSSNTDFSAAPAAPTLGSTWILSEGVYATATDGSVLNTSAFQVAVEIDGHIVVQDTLETTKYAAQASGNDSVITVGATGSVTTLGLYSIGLRVGAAGEISNAGTISSEGTAVWAGAGGNVVNTGSIQGEMGAVYLESGAQLDNSGLITGPGAFGVVSGFSSVSVRNSGTISGDYVAVQMTSGTVLNSGSIQGDSYAIYVSGDASVQNSGTIQGGVSGISTVGKTVLVNDGAISGGDFGVLANGEFSSITNSGTILASSLTGVGLTVTDDCTITNSGVISGQSGGVSLADGNNSLMNSGTILGDVILGGGSDVFDGRGGHVSGEVVGGAGNDLFRVDDPALRIVEAVGGGNDTVEASVSFTLAAGQEIEALTLTGTALRGTGNEFANTVTGNDEDNRLSGLAGADSLTGGLGNDTLSGGTENDTLSGGDGGDQLNGSDGNDVLNGQNDDDTLTGGAGTDKLNGNAGDDVLKGGAANDTLSGGDGDDQVTGGMGRDSMTGGNDVDTFVFTRTAETGLVASGTADVITDFTAGSDRIDLSAIDAKSGTAANDAFVFLGSGAFTGTAGQLHFVVGGPNIVLEGDVTGDGVADFQIQLNGIATISAGDLVL